MVGSTRPWYGAAPAWLGGVPLPGSGGNLVGKGWAPPLVGTPQPSVGSKPRRKHMDPHLRYGRALPGMHGDLNITHGAGGVVTITHQPHGEDAGDASHPGAADAQSPNYGSGSIAVDTDPLVSEVDVSIGDVHGIGTPGSFDTTLTGGGMSPDSMASDLGWYNDLSDTMNDDANAFQGYADDPYSPPLREPTKRNYGATFGFDWSNLGWFDLRKNFPTPAGRSLYRTIQKLPAEMASIIWGDSAVIDWQKRGLINAEPQAHILRNVLWQKKQWLDELTKLQQQHPDLAGLRGFHGEDFDIGFEHEMYSGFGPAAIIGCEMGCATDTEMLG